MSASDKAARFLRMAVTLPIEEIKDERDETDIPEISQVAELRDSSSMQEAIEYGTAIMKMFPDIDLIPFMIAYMYYQKDYPKRAIEVALEAIPRCKRKFRLYSVIGLAEFSQGHLPEALVWWARSVVAQCKVVDFQEEDPFLHLAHAASVIGADEEAKVYFAVADAIVPERRRLTPDEVDRLLPLRNHWSKEPLKQVLRHIIDTYALA